MNRILQDLCLSGPFERSGVLIVSTLCGGISCAEIASRTLIPFTLSGFGFDVPDCSVDAAVSYTSVVFASSPEKAIKTRA
jgi:hypothetical protein